MKTILNRICLLVYLIAIPLLLTVCSQEDKNGNDNTPTGEPIITDIGTPVGSKVSTSVGPEGGTIKSDDGFLTLTIPSGALSTATEVSIQPISNEAPLGIGTAYRLEPEGTTFSIPVKLTFSYTNELLDGSPSDFLWIVTQNSNGSWNAALKSVVDENTKTVTVEANHFSDWALGKFIDFVLAPSSKTIKKGESVALKLTGFSRDKEVTEDDDLTPLVPLSEEGDVLTPLTPIPPIESRLMDFRVKEWTMNGATAPVSNSNGKLSASGTTATYIAPDKKPTVNPVAVTVELESGNKEGKKASYFVTANISIVNEDLYLLVNFNGQEYEYYEYGFNGTIPPDINYYNGVNCALDNGVLSIAATTVLNSSNMVNSFALVFANPSVTSRRLSGFNEDGDDDIIFQIYPSSAYMLDYTKYTYDAAHDICNYEYKCSDVTVTLTTYDRETHIARGFFTGEIYSETKDSNGEHCTTAEKFPIEGEFNLYMAN